MARHPGSGEALGKAASAYERLKAFAINGQLKLGRRLGAQDLAEYFGISQTPVRDAMTRLAFEGFIGREASHGFYSKDFTVEEQRQLLCMTFILLTASVHCALGTLPIPLLEEIAALDPGLGDRPDAPELLTERLETLHHGLAKASGNDILTEVGRTMVERTHLVRLIDMRRPEAAGETIEALTAFARALMAGEVEAGVAIVRGLLDGRLERLPLLVKEANGLAAGARFP